MTPTGCEDGQVTPVILIRHAEPLRVGETPATVWPLSDRGRNDARALGRTVACRTAATVVLTSPERKALETAELAFPFVVAGVRDQLSEVTKPWYDSADGHANAVAAYLRGVDVEGWESREDVLTRITQLTWDFRVVDRPVLVSHGVLLTTWLDHVIGLDDPFSFWSHLRMPDAWELDLQQKSLQWIP